MKARAVLNRNLQWLILKSSPPGGPALASSLAPPYNPAPEFWRIQPRTARHSRCQMEPLSNPLLLARRQFFTSTASGLGAAALASLLTRDGLLAADSEQHSANPM